MMNKFNIRFSCYIIPSKTMRHFSRNECTMDAISVVEHCCKGEILNWSAFILNELFEACEDVYRQSTNFLFGYILMSLAMWKWRLPREREMMNFGEGQPIALHYKPWRASGDPITKDINEMTFRDWYELMLMTIRLMQRITKTLLDEFSKEIWFEASHVHTYLRPRCVHLETFKMRPQRFVLTATTLHTEVGSWPGVACEIIDGKYNYLFGP